MVTVHLGSNEGQSKSKHTQAGEFHQAKPVANSLLQSQNKSSAFYRAQSQQSFHLLGPTHQPHVTSTWEPSEMRNNALPASAPPGPGFVTIAPWQGGYSSWDRLLNLSSAWII